MAKELILQVERVEYQGKDGNTKVAYNYFVELDLGITKLKVQLKPNDYTARELLDSYLIK